MTARIGITSWAEARDDKPVVEINRSFVDGVVRSGGVPLVLPVVGAHRVGAMVPAIDGLVLTGGIDIDPRTYGAERHRAVTLVERARDDFEIALCAAARAADLPVLGLCRGAQLVNVAHGGTLLQHLPDVTELDHNVRDRVHEVVHDVRVEPGSLLAEVTGDHDRLAVNSLHHQAVDRLGEDLRAVACAEDGVVEAIESGDRRVLGVQWHPELMLDGPPGHSELFDWVVERASASAV